MPCSIVVPLKGRKIYTNYTPDVWWRSSQDKLRGSLARKESGSAWKLAGFQELKQLIVQKPEKNRKMLVIDKLTEQSLVVEAGKEFDILIWWMVQRCWIEPRNRQHQGKKHQRRPLWQSTAFIANFWMPCSIVLLSKKVAKCTPMTFLASGGVQVRINSGVLWLEKKVERHENWLVSKSAIHRWCKHLEWSEKSW